MEIYLYSEVNVISIVILMMIVICALRAGTLTMQRRTMFVASGIFAAASNVFDFIWNLAQTYSVSMMAYERVLVNFCYFLCVALSTYHWLMYTEVSFRKLTFTKKIRIFATIPMVVLCAVLVVSSFNGCAFYIDANDVYHRGPLFFSQHILSYGYIFIASLVCLLRAFRKSNYDRRDELLAMASFALPPFACALIQTVFQRMPILPVGIMISFVWAYIQMLSNKVSNDELTQIPHRNEMVRRVAYEIKNLGMGENLYLLFMDIDQFKMVNDKYSHEEGDRALITLANVLKMVAKKTDGFCARYGGDEFTFLAKCRNDNEVQHVMDEIHNLAEKKSWENNLKCTLRISIGYARYDETMDSIQEFMSAADAAMYEVKKRKKEGLSRA